MFLKRVTKKFHSKAGESIAETLVALLISALALTMLAGAISAASNMIKISRDKLATYYDQSENMATFKDADTVTITVSLNDVSQDASIKYVTNTAFNKTPVVAYKKSNS